MWKLSSALSGAVSLLALGMAQAQDAPIALEEITVEGRGAGAGRAEGAAGVVTTDGYVAKTGRTATKTDTPLNETPQTISTVTRRQLDDQRPQNLQEILGYTPGVQTGLAGFDPRFDSFFIRGVDVTYTGVFRDGLRQFNSPNGLFRLEPYGLEAVSILKGPSSAIYGASASAGVVDLISKRPTDYRFGEVELQTGSYDRLQGAFDIGGPANEAGTVLYRMTGLARNAGTEQGPVNDNRLFVAPAVTFQPNDDTKLTLLGEYLEGLTGGSAAYQNRYVGDNSVGVIPIPLSFKDFNDFEQRQGRVGYELEHRLNPFVTLHQNVRFSALDTRQEYSGQQPRPDLPGAPTINSTGLIKERVYGAAADTYLLTEATTGPVGHKIMTGLDFSYLTYDSRTGFGTFSDPENIPTPTVANKSTQDQTLVGVYAQDELAWNAWRLTLGGRYDWFDSKFKNGLIGEPYGGAQKQDDGKFTGRAALSYVTSAGFTPYVGYGTSFVPNPGTAIDGDVVRPTIGEQVEAGVKYAIPGKNASINASVYSLKQEDGLVFAVDGSGTNQLTQLDFRSRGFEIEGTASLTNGVNLIASYSYTDVTIDAPQSIEGKQLTGIPKHAFTVWAGYDVKDGPAKGLGLGAGVRYTGQSFGDNANRSVISNDPRAFVDAKASYELENLDTRLKGVTLQVNANNLLDEVKQICNANYCYFNEGRRVIASLKYRW